MTERVKFVAKKKMCTNLSRIKITATKKSSVESKKYKQFYTKYVCSTRFHRLFASWWCWFIFLRLVTLSFLPIGLTYRCERCYLREDLFQKEKERFNAEEKKIMELKQMNKLNRERERDWENKKKNNQWSRTFTV